MGELPRITRALRAHTQLDPYKGLSPRKKQNKRRICKIKSHKGYKTLDDIRRYIKRHETNAEQLLIILEDIRTACTKLTTGEDDHDILDDATVVVLRMFLDQRMCMIQHTHSLKMLFGAVTNSISNGLYEAVKKISVKLSDETKAYIKEEKVVQPTEDPWGSNIECMFSVTKPEKKKKFKLYEPPATESKFVTEFSMAYTGPSTSGKTEATTNGKKKSDKTKTSNAKEKNKGKKKVPETTKPQTRPEFCQEWFERKAAQCRIPGILQPLLDLIHSKRSNEDIQNDLFDLLGYEHIDFIQDLLMHRQELVSDLLRPRTPPPPTLAEMQAQLPEKKMPQYLCQVSVLSEHERKLAKLVNKEEKKEKKAKKAVENNNKEELYGFNVAELRARIKPVVKPTLPFSLKKLKDSDPILQRISYSQTKVQYPNVYDMSLQAKTSAGYLLGTKMMLPQDIIRKNTNEYEEVILPKNDPPPLEVGNQRVAISSLDEMGQMAFENIKELNRIQSVVFPTAYNTNENLLICAPTGAGKTNIALLTVVHQIKQYTENQIIQKNKFKIIYIAPMKALASEMTASFGKRLRGLGIAVRELTGDMKLSKFEVSQTQMIVTTPEKWDVVTRKGATDIELSALVKLIIIDEVHLLHGDRGPVVESIVARTLRQVESSQNMIRIVGLSATLPNYLDVARFLRVNPNVGLFFFDGRFRPVPLEQQFIGVKETNNTKSHLDKVQTMNQICYDKAIEELRHGNQVMIFVHSRNATQNLATVIKSTAQIKNDLKHFEPDQTAAYLKAKKAISSSRNNELQQLFVCGIAIHHAGMLRSDRNMVEKYFTECFIKVLVSTSTLAWGVNLPAHCVIIRGTDIYDENRGAMVDLSILDVLQIFGRAGRPQFDTSGVGIIITLHDKLSHYLTSMTNQFPIESNFISHLADNLNAEIALGTVSDVSEAVEWLSYTYLFVRMRINPQAYGLNYYDVQCDPTLEAKRLEVITAAAMRLDKAQMIRFNDITGELHTTDLGRTASHFYITCVTMERFNAKVRKLMSEGQIIDMLSNCSDFEQIKVRKEEISELRTLQKRHCQLKIGSRSEDLHWKISVLLQTYLSRGQITSFSLISDLNYMIQNAVRVIRALFEITLRKNNAYMAAMYLKLAHMMELQTWDFCSVMRQFNCFSAEVLRHIENPLLRIDQLRDMDEKSLGALVRNPSAAKHLKKCADEFPLLEMDASLHPISRTILRIRLYITPNFRWSDKHHGKSEAFWVWVEDPESDIMYYHEFFVLTKKQVISREPQEMIITIPILEPMPPQYYIRATSEKWLGSESVLPLTFHHLILPESHPPHTEVLYLRPLPKKALRNPEYEALYPFSHFNPIQTQIFHCLYYSDVNVLLGASTGSGKTIAAEITMFRSFNVYPQCKVVYIAPLKALVKERMKDWKIRMEQKLCKRVVELTGDVSPDVRAIKSADIIVTTPEKWDGISRSWQTRSYVQDVALIIMDEIHMLGEDRGPVLEVIVSRAKFIEHHSSRKIRIVGLSTALANACDLADWLGIKEKGVFNFRPSVRPVALRIHIAGFPGRHYCPRMMTMNKPTFQAIKTHSPNKPVLVFVSSRRQTRLTGQDLIAYLAAEENPKQWLNMDESALEQVLSGIKDSNLKLMLAFGVGLHHAGLHEKDRTTVEELFVNRKIQVLICTATLSWGVNFPAHLVVIKGTEYFDTKQKRYVDMPITDVMQMMGRAGRPQYDINGEVVLLVHDQKKNFYRKFLYEPFPVESSLLEVLPDHVNAEIVAGTVQSIPDILDYMTWTFFYRRLMKNPTYYNLESLEEDDINNYMTTLITGAVEVLERANCVELGPDGLSVQTTWMGRIASYYYLSHKTMAHFNVNLYHNITADELMWTLAHCEEYSGLPVRHNEDVLNGELSQTCRIRVDPLTLDSAHTKALLLLQAHLSRAPLPNADYLTDTKSVLDQTIRILQAMIDATAENGWLNACLLCQQLMQSIIQARWPTDSPLTTLPYVNSRHLYLFTKMAKETKKPCTMLNGLKIACLKSHEWLAKYLRKEFDEMDIEMIATVLRELPTLDVDVSVRGLWLNSQTDEERPVNKRPKKGQWIPLHAGQEYDLSLNMRRRGGKGPVFCPYFPRAKNENWFVTLGCIEYGELLALKRVAGRGRANIRFVAPDQKGRVIYTLYILSDSYMGLDQQYSFQFEILDPLPPDTFDRAYGQLVQGDKASA